MNISLEINAGRFRVQTAETIMQRREAFRLRYQVFQVEMIGHPQAENEDTDEFDENADHLLIYETNENKLIATCRLNSSLFAKKFYTEQEFNCSSLLARPAVKLEIGRVCVHRDYRKGIVLILLWRAIAQYIFKTKTEVLFGCGSVMTTDPYEAALVYKFLEIENKVRPSFDVHPQSQFLNPEFAAQYNRLSPALPLAELKRAAELLPSLCRSYFDIGCFVPGPPAFDYDFKCIDFLTVLEVNELSPHVRKKIMGQPA